MRRGSKATLINREKLSRSQKGRSPSQATRNKQHDAMVETCKDPIVKKRKSDAMKKKWQDPEYIAKQEAAHADPAKRTGFKPGPDNPSWNGGITLIHTPLEEAKDCGAWLGVHIAERVLSTFFDHMERMPVGNKGFDYMCGKGFKIDVKASCLRKGKWGNPFWGFSPDRNMMADYFLCIAFNNRNELEPMHIWLIPGNRINNQFTFVVTNSKIGLEKWSQYEKPLGNVISCCNKMKNCDRGEYVDQKL